MTAFFQGTLEVLSINDVADNTKKIILKSSEKEFSFSSGQFLNIDFGKDLWRSYSIASTSNQENIELVIRIIPNGLASEKWRTISIGDKLSFKGPFGRFLLSENQEAELVFCCTGTGIAPIKSMILSEMKKELPRRIRIFYGGKNLNDLAYIDEIENWSKDLEIKLGLSREEDPSKLGKFGEKCRITKFLEEEDFPKTSEFYICGNKNMVKSVTDILESKEIKKQHIFSERF